MPIIELLPGDIVLYVWNRNPEKGPINPPHCVWKTYEIIDAAQKWTGHLTNDVMHIGIVVGRRPKEQTDQKEHDPTVYTEYLVAHSLAGKGTRITPLELDHPIIVLRPADGALAKQLGYMAKMFCLEKRVGELQRSYLSHLSYLLYLSYLNFKASAGAVYDLFSNQAPSIPTESKENEVEDPFIFYSTTKAFLSLFVPMFYNVAPSVESIHEELDHLVFGDREIAWHCSEFVVKLLKLAADILGLDATHTANTTHIISPHDLAQHLMESPNFRVVKPKAEESNIFMFPREQKSEETTIGQKRKEIETPLSSAHGMELRATTKRARAGR